MRFATTTWSSRWVRPSHWTRLALGSVSTQVDVKATAPLLERNSAELGGVVGSADIANLPTNGRNWANLLVLAPGAIDDGGGNQRTIRFGGRGRDDNNFKFDGVDATGIQEQAQKSTTRLLASKSVPRLDSPRLLPSF